jgi:putative spermidine/putrescine transport system permease protein
MMRPVRWALLLAMLVLLLLPLLAGLALGLAALAAPGAPWLAGALAAFGAAPPAAGGDWAAALRPAFLRAAEAAVLACLAGVPLAFALAGVGRGRMVLLSVLALPVLAPTAILAATEGFVAGPLGAGGDWPSLVAHACLALPFATFPAVVALARRDPLLARAATACGAGPVAVFRLLTLPLLLPALLGGLLLAFAASLDQALGTLWHGVPAADGSGLGLAMLAALLAGAGLLAELLAPGQRAA